MFPPVQVLQEIDTEEDWVQIFLSIRTTPVIRHRIRFKPRRIYAEDEEWGYVFDWFGGFTIGFDILLAVLEKEDAIESFFREFNAGVLNV